MDEDNLTLCIMCNDSYADYDDQSNYHWTRYLNSIGIPVIICMGIVGNMISLAVFLFTRMRSQTCSIYLAHLNIMDTCFLLCLIPAELGWFHIDLVNQNGWCQITVFASFVFSFLSTWTVVSFTVERYIVVYHPLRKPSMCTKKRALKVLIALDVGAFLAYSCTLAMTGVTANNYYNIEQCTPLPRFKDAFQVIITIDTVVTLVIPFFAIIILNVAIIIKIYAFAQQSRLLSGSSSRYDPDTNYDSKKYVSGTAASTSNTNSSCENDKMINSMTGNNHNTHIQVCETLSRNDTFRKNRMSAAISKMQESSTRRRRQYRIKTTRSLVLISSGFLLLNMPSHVFRVYSLFTHLYDYDPNLSQFAIFIHEISMLIYYFNFACNVFLYVLCSQSFRYGFLSLLKATKKIMARQQRHCIQVCRQVDNHHCSLNKCCVKIKLQEPQDIALRPVNNGP